MQEIQIKNIGPIASVTIPVPESGGVVVLTAECEAYQRPPKSLSSLRIRPCRHKVHINSYSMPPHHEAAYSPKRIPE